MNLFSIGTSLKNTYEQYRELLFKEGWKSIYNDIDSERFLKNGVVVTITFSIKFNFF